MTLPKNPELIEKYKERQKQNTIRQFKQMTKEEKITRSVNISDAMKSKKIVRTKEFMNRCVKTRRKNGNYIFTEKTKVNMSKNHRRYQSKDTRRKIRETMIRHVEIKKLNGEPLVPNIGRNETKILDSIEECIGYLIKRQHKVMGYFLDGYCQILNLAIEVDEDFHYVNGKLSDSDIRRQKEIQQELNCKFLRIQSGGDLVGSSTS